MSARRPPAHHLAYSAPHLNTRAAQLLLLHTTATCHLHLHLHLDSDSRCTRCTGTWRTQPANQFLSASQIPPSTTMCRLLLREAASQAAKVQPASPAQTSLRTRAPPRTASATRAGSGVALNSSSSLDLHSSSSSAVSSGSRLINPATTPPTLPSHPAWHTMLPAIQPIKTTTHLPRHTSTETR